jgi:hypothetical protein
MSDGTDLDSIVPAGVYRVANTPPTTPELVYAGWFSKRWDEDGTQYCTNYDARKQETTHWIKRPGREWARVITAQGPMARRRGKP